MFFGQQGKGSLSDRAGGQQNKSTVSGTGGPESAQVKAEIIEDAFG